VKISVVTISYNQAEYLKVCIESVINQRSSNVDVEYIVVDAGSTDGSREILSLYNDEIDHQILESDSGPADGLNKGFSVATGDILYYLNSDDIVLPGAFDDAIRLFYENPDVGVICGAGVFLDSEGNRMRPVWPDPISRHRIAYGGCILVQPATFIRSSAFHQAGGFNAENLTNWDGELIADLFLEGEKFMRCNKLWGGYRLHPSSITSSGKHRFRMKAWHSRRKSKMEVNYPHWIEKALFTFYRFERVLRHPSVVLSRLKYGRVFGAG